MYNLIPYQVARLRRTWRPNFEPRSTTSIGWRDTVKTSLENTNVNSICCHVGWLSQRNVDSPRLPMESSRSDFACFRELSDRQWPCHLWRISGGLVPYQLSSVHENFVNWWTLNPPQLLPESASVNCMPRWFTCIVRQSLSRWEKALHV